MSGTFYFDPVKSSSQQRKMSWAHLPPFDYKIEVGQGKIYIAILEKCFQYGRSGLYKLSPVEIIQI